MKDYIKERIKDIDDNNRARCIVREYLQARILQILQDSGAFVNWAFVGGTSLRFLYSIPRFSEDLDFSLVHPGAKDCFAEYINKAETAFKAENYDVIIKSKLNKTVKSAFIKLRGLLFEIGLTAHQNETISLKVDIDTNPPAGATLKTSIVRKHLIVNIQHYDEASLFAGKLHAVITRAYSKGRDIYDLLWYLSDRSWPAPNIDLLNNALTQTGWEGPRMTGDNWKMVVKEKINSLDWNTITRDVSPFLERPRDIELLNRDHFIKLLE